MSTTELHRVVGGRYLLERDLGPSSVGRAFLARDRQHDRLVHLRLVDDQSGHDVVAFARLGREIATSFLVVHPNTVEVIDYGETPRERFLVSEHLDAITLRELLRVEGPQPAARVARIGLQVASALAAAHQEGIVHRGLAPETVLLVRDETGDVAKVRDFGLAKIDDGQDVTRTGVRVGHAPYLPPEYLTAGQFTPKGDLYALGCLLAELLVGREAAAGEGIVLAAPLTPPALLAVIDALRAPEPTDRPGIHAVIDRLHSIDEASSPRLALPTAVTSRRASPLLFLFGALLFGGILALALLTAALVLSLPTS
ncbi:MAG: serine/threonine-protein kinase [Myxococcota bacterium]